MITLLRNCNDNELSESQEQEMCDYLKERLDKSEVVGLRDKFWVKMLLAKRKKLCAWYARYRGNENEVSSADLICTIFWFVHN